MILTMFDNTKTGDKPTVTKYKAGHIDMVKVPYEVREISPGIFSWREISVRYFDYNYGGLVSAIISLKYSPDEMTAVINNYLLDADDESMAAFKEMQEYRKYAKATAKTILGIE